MSGARYRPAADASPLQVIAEVEELLRRILKALATGELEGDLRTVADEQLLAKGLRAADVAKPEMGEVAEWRVPETSEDGEMALGGLADGYIDGEIEIHRTADEEDDTDDAGVTSEVYAVTHEPHQPTRIVVDHVELPHIVAPEKDKPEEKAPVEASAEPSEKTVPEKKADWFSTADGTEELDWPAFASPHRDRGERKEEASESVRHLFPVPDATDWDVGELRYERKRSS